MQEKHFICALDTLQEKQSFGFRAPNVEGFVVIKDKNVFGYRNVCPHIGMNLEFQEHRFLDADHAFIQCSMHGALFEIENGLCVHGPCLNQALAPLRIQVEDEKIFFIQD